MIIPSFKKQFQKIYIIIIAFFMMYITLPIYGNAFSSNTTTNKTRMLWIDAESDLLLLSTKSSVQIIMDKCTASGVNTIAVDIKPYSGYVLYDSKIAPKITSFKGQPYPEKFNLLKSVIQEGHKRGLKVHAALNIFSEGIKADRLGPVFIHPEWESVIYDVSNFIRTTTGAEFIISEYNQKNNDNSLVIYTPDYGSNIYSRDNPKNAIDENTTSNSSRWVSGSESNQHWLVLEWTTPQKLDTVTLHFVKNYILSKYRIQYSNNGRWSDLVVITNNNQLNTTHSFAPVIARRLRLLIEDTGVDTIARLAEIEVFSIQGSIELNNIAPQSRIYSDSIFKRDFKGKYYLIENHKVTEEYADNDFPNEGLSIPRNGYFISVDGKARLWAESSLSTGTPVNIVTRSRFIPESQYPGGMLVYVNPSHPEVRERALSIIKEVVDNHAVDGIILDRVRYDNFRVDFSDISRRQFENFIGETIKRWPEDIYEITITPNGTKIIEGKYYKEWIYWRASVIKDFMEEARRIVKESKPNIEFGDYVGSWYPTYYEVGVNWASTNYDPNDDYDWATPGYRGTGYADSLDYLCPGLYYPELTIVDALRAGKKEYSSLEGGIQLLNKVVGNFTKVYGSLYYPNIASPEKFKKAVKMCLDKTDGVMIFSMINFEKGNKWQLLKEAFQESIEQNALEISNKSLKSSTHLKIKDSYKLD